MPQQPIIRVDIDYDQHLKITENGPQTADKIVMIPLMDPMTRINDKPVMNLMLMGVATGCSHPVAPTFLFGILTLFASSLTSATLGPVCRKGDIGICTGLHMMPNGVTVPCSCTVEITDATQEDVVSD